MNQKLETLRNRQSTHASGSGSKKKPLSAESQRNPRDRSRKYSDLLIPFGLITGFLLVAILLFGDRLLPAKQVGLVSVLVRQEVAMDDGGAAVGATNESAYEMTSLFQASGWIEANPYPFRASALVNGFVEEVRVLEGERVEKGDVIATLIKEDATLDVETAKSRLGQARAQLSAAQNEVEITEAEKKTLEARIDAARAKLAEVDDIAARMLTLAQGAVPEQDVTQALLRQKTQQAEVASLESEFAQIEAKLQQKLQQMEVRKMDLKAAEIELERKQLALDRTDIRSPISGFIQSLHAAPGQKKVLGSDNPESATIAMLYHPGSLQARIDVPLEEAGKLSIGQAAIVKTSFLPNEVFRGKVVRIAGESDIQRNTLQAKIEILDPDLKLRPEMLCRAEFLAPAPSSGGLGSDTSGRFGIFVPESAITERFANSGTVFRLDESRKRVERVEVQISGDPSDGYFQVVSGLRAGDQLVDRPDSKLNDQQRIQFQK